MLLKGLVDEDIANYKKISMFVIFPKCNFKCDKENGNHICQNYSLAKEPNIKFSIKELVQRYLLNPISKAIVCGGLEPMDSFDDLYELISELRKYSDDDIVIYTGYKERECQWEIEEFKKFKNIIIKFGRYVPNKQSHFDELLGINLASPNQYAKKIS